MPYYPSPTGISSLAGLLSYANTVTWGLAVPTFLLILWTLIFIIPKNMNYPTVPCYTVASLITFIVSMMFNAVNLVAPEITYALIIMTAIGGILLWNGGS